MSVGLAYGDLHQRYKMCTPDCTSPTSTTYYLYDPVTGGMSEKVVSGSNTTWNDYVAVDGQIVAARINTGSTANWKYVVGDHLGSPASINGCSMPGCVVEHDSYDAWGKRRNPDASDDSGCTLTSVLTRGFTQHEMLDSFCLVNMNGRVYDPGLGLFISADSMVPNPYDFTGFQRYSYVGNNPLNAIDPSGHTTTDDHHHYWSTDGLPFPCWCWGPGISVLGDGESIYIDSGNPADGAGHWGTHEITVQEAGISTTTHGLYWVPDVSLTSLYTYTPATFGNDGGGTRGISKVMAPLLPMVSPLRPTPEGPSDDDDDNERERKIDFNVCRQFTGALASACYQSALKRDWARRNGKPLPPLITSLFAPRSSDSFFHGGALFGLGATGVAICAVVEPCGAAAASLLGLTELSIWATQ
ncbi:MAG TPA: RHS repeat-associated core domain-containing protein [Rhizomicrobium sp.]|nr:RHS repeat-associated core domain-containing protein [Rhizomicrobium sp.]